MRKIGITTTIPSEVIYAAGLVPVDLNNIFVTHPDRIKLIRRAELAGFPRNFCAWIKGIYSVVLETGIKDVLLVVQGDCSSSVILADILKLHDINIIPFSYPAENSQELLRASINRLIKRFNTDWDNVAKQKTRLDGIRKKVHEIDRLTWQEGVVSGFENHYFSVCTSDMKGNPDLFENELDRFIQTVSSKKKKIKDIKIACVGVPPVIDNLFSFIEELGAGVVLNETQRQFTMPYYTSDIVEQYSLYTYPYSVYKRVEDIKKEIVSRKIDGIIHYVQSFCHHQAEHIILKKTLPVPVLSLECDSPGEIDARSKMRVEAFLNVIRNRNGAQ